MKKIIIFSTLLFGVNLTSAQDLESVLLAGEDANLLLQNYLNPVAKGIMTGMNNGWYSTAKSHKKLGFDITFGVNAAFTPDKDQMFDFISDQYNFVSLADGRTQLPTVLSKDDTETALTANIPYQDGKTKAVTFNFPGGVAKDLPVNAVPSPFVQVGLGLPFKTTVKLRYVPKTEFGSDVNANLIGVGLQHDLTQYLGLIGKLPFSVSLFGAYTSANVNYDIENSTATSAVMVTNGLAEFKLRTWTLQALGSLDFKIMTFYGGLGFNGGTTTFDIKGDYVLEYQVESSGGQGQEEVTETVTDPIGLKFNSSGPRATIGARLNLAFLKIFADYTLQEYNTASVGVALSFR